MIYGNGAINEMLDSGEIVIDPIDRDLQIQPASVDLRMSDTFREFTRNGVTHIDPMDNVEDVTEPVQVDDEYVLHPGQFVLGSTVEHVELPDYQVGRVEGRSSLGRLAVVVHATAGYVDPGWKGDITLELSNLGESPVVLTPGMRVCQLVFEHAKGVTEGYNGKYQNQSGPSESRLSRDPEFTE